MSCWNSEGQNNSLSAQHQFGEMISGYPQETWAPTWKWEKNLKKKIKKGKKEKKRKKMLKKKGRSVLQEWLCTENCLIILLIKCEPDENSFPSPRAQLGWQEFKEEQLFHKGEQVCPSPRQQELENTEVTAGFAVDFWGGRILPFEKICWIKPALVRVFSSKSIHLSRAFCCFHLFPSTCPIQN